MSVGMALLVGLLVVLAALALRRGEGTFRAAVWRTVEQFWLLVPRVVCALIAAGFIAALIPSAFIGGHLGPGAGASAILIAFGAGAIIPAGPAIAFSIGAVFAQAGASTPALITFIAAWTVFAAHRIVIYEIPLLGPTFLRLRLIAAGGMPLLAGVIAFAAFALVGSGGPLM